MSARNGLTDAQDELLEVLIGECAEAIQIATKIQRFGLHSIHPFKPGPDNQGLFEEELGHIRNAMIMLGEAGMVRKEEIHRHADEKRATIHQWLRCS